MPEQVRHDEKRTTRGRHFMELGITRSAVVTGGASGLGAATARALAASGVKVAIFDLQAEKGEQIATEIGGTFCAVDVTSDESVDAGFAKARAANGQESILVCCARSEEHTSELQSLMRISYAVFCLQKKINYI